jgi:hypothetical protein
VANVNVTAPHLGSALDERSAAVINEVLEGERGSVAALVQLSAMATDALERHALVVTGGQAAQACIDLRGVLERHGAQVSQRVGVTAEAILLLERLDERYLAFAALQRALMLNIESIASARLDAVDQGALAMVHTIQSAQSAWAFQRARDFAASRAEAQLSANRPDDATGGQLADAESPSGILRGEPARPAAPTDDALLAPNAHASPAGSMDIEAHHPAVDTSLGGAVTPGGDA